LALAVTAAAVTGAVLLSLPDAMAATGGVTGFAAQNGGTTGGAGGQVVSASTGTAIHQALCNRASASTPIIIQVSGTITLGNTTQVSSSTKACNTAASQIELKDVSNVTLVGVGSGAIFDQIGIHVRDSHNIIIQNVTVQNVKKSNGPTSNGGDAIGMESSVSNVWVDHNTLIASGGESQGYDSLIDMKSGTTYVTVSYNTFTNSGRGGLVGYTDSDTGNGPVTFHHNLYTNIDSRTPLLRAATAHIYNNYYVSLNKSGINPRDGGKARVENNYFKNSADVLGTFYTDLMGTWQTSGNILDNVTWTAEGSQNHPAGPSMASNGSVSIPYSYSLDPAACVPSIVTATAGAGKGMQVSNGSCSAPTTTAATTRPPTTAPPTTAPPTTVPPTTVPPTTRPPTTVPPTTTPPTTRPPTTSAAPGTGACSATYAKTGEWSGGFQAAVTVTAGSSAISAWTVRWSWPNGQAVTSFWSATITSSGSAVTATNVSYNGQLSAGQSTSFGFLGSWSGTNSAPTLTCTAS
jgi:pectate lyase